MLLLRPAVRSLVARHTSEQGFLLVGKLHTAVHPRTGTGHAPPASASAPLTQQEPIARRCRVESQCAPTLRAPRRRHMATFSARRVSISGYSGRRRSVVTAPQLTDVVVDSRVSARPSADARLRPFERLALAWKCPRCPHQCRIFMQIGELMRITITDNTIGRVER